MKLPDIISIADNIMLRAWRPEDASWYVESRDEEIFKWTTEERDLTIPAAEEAIGRANEDESSFCYAIVAHGSNQLLGNIALVRDKTDQQAAEVMYWLASWARGRGIASKALSMLCQWAFDNLGVERIFLKTFAENASSLRVARRVGFLKMSPGNAREGGCNQVWFVLSRPRFSH